MKVRLSQCMLLLLFAYTAGAQTLKPAKIELYATDSLQAPQSVIDYFPFQQMDLSHTNLTFVLAICEYNIEWDDPEKPDETLQATYADLVLSSTDGESLPPVASMTADQRIVLLRNPAKRPLEASEKQHHSFIRFGAVFLASDDSKQFTLSFAGTTQEVTCSAEEPPDASGFARVEILESTLTQSMLTGNNQIERLVPATQVQLSTPVGQLLCVSIRVIPQAPNVIGSDIRYIFHPSDFTLLTNGNIHRILGFKGRNFMTDSVYNLRRESLEKLPEATAEITLIFIVPEDFGHGELAFMGTPIGEIEPAP